MTTPQRPPKDGIRAMPPGSLQGDGKTLTGRLATGWAEIESVAEGHFMERFAPGAFRKTFTENRDNIKILFQHGRDNSVGQQPIAVLEDVGEDADGAYYRAELLDGVPPLILDGLRRGVYGSSHTFRVVREDWEPRPKGGAHNPKKLPERVVREALVWEFGPVTWPAYAGQALARSMSDEFQLATLTEDPEHLRNLVNYIDPDAPSVGAEAQPHPDPERREAVAPPTTPKKEPTTVDITQYRTRDEMSARRRELDAEITRMAELPGVLADPDQADWDSKTEERTALDAAITAWDARVAVAEKIARDKPENTVAYTPPNVFARKSESDIYDLDAVHRNSRNAEQRDQMLRDNAMRSIEITTNLTDSNRDHAANLVDYKDSRNKELATRIITTGSPQYRRAWNSYVSNGERGTALAVGADGTGGFAVPYAYDLSVIGTGAWTYINPFRAACRVEQIVGTDTWRGLTANAVVAAFDDEAAAATEQGPTFVQPEIIVKKAHAFVTYSIEMGQDRPDLGQELGVLIGEAKDNLEEAEFAVGTGATHHPHGMLSPLATLLYTHIEATTAHALVIADIDLMEATLPLRHRRNAAWFMNKAIFRVIQGLETTGGRLFGGDYYASVAANGGSPNGTLRPILGYPTYEVPSAVATLLTDDLFVLWFGDPKSFVIVDRVGMSVEYIPTIFGAAQGNLPTGQRGLYAYWRTNSDTVNADAGRLLQVKNA